MIPAAPVLWCLSVTEILARFALSRRNADGPGQNGKDIPSSEGDTHMYAENRRCQPPKKKYKSCLW
jgi:hypothetical protein